MKPFSLYYNGLNIYQNFNGLRHIKDCIFVNIYAKLKVYILILLLTTNNLSDLSKLAYLASEAFIYQTHIFDSMAFH